MNEFILEGAGPQVGYQHYSNGASGPMPCYESAVDVRRGYVEFALTDLQRARHPHATLNATIGGFQGACLTWIEDFALPMWTLPAGDGPYNYIPVFKELGGGPPNPKAITRHGFGGRAAMTTGNHLSSNFGEELGSTIYAAFESPNDGFGDDWTPPTSFPQDNNSCLAQFSKVSLDLAYPPMPPDTPLGCSGTVACTGATISCAWEPDVLTLVAHTSGRADRVAQTIDATSGPVAVHFADPAGTPETTYSVCAGSVCSAVPITNTCDFSLSPPNTVSIPAGVTSVPIELTADGTYGGTIALSLAGAPAALFSATPSASTLSVTLEESTMSVSRASYFTLAAGFNVAPQSAILTLTGSGGEQSHAYQIPVTVTPCVPKSCASIGAICGEVADGCGGPPVSCGTCGSNTTCSTDQSTCCPNTSSVVVNRLCLSGGNPPNPPPVHCKGESCQ
jgi:hypothetical protein